MSKPSNEPMQEMFIFETNQLIEQLEQVLITSEKSNSYSSNDVNEIFRIMHTIKGSSAMMMYNNISNLSHTIEDLFYFIRESNPSYIDFPKLTDLVLNGADFIKTELVKIEEGAESNSDSGVLIEEINIFLADLKKINTTPQQPCENDEIGVLTENQKYSIEKGNLSNDSANRFFKAVIHLDEDCKMENIRAIAIIHSIKDIASYVYYSPSNAIDNDEREEIIKKDGLEIIIRTDCTMEVVHELLMHTIFLNHLSLEELDDDAEFVQDIKAQIITSENDLLIQPNIAEKEQLKTQSISFNQSMISVNISKLDKLMDIVGELVISEAMVTHNPDLNGLSLENFNKAARQHRKITSELQDTVMSIRMVTLSATFQRMNRILRDMCKKLDKNVNLEIIGDETEVDKNIVEHITDPLMHIIRNSIDHGIESAEERVSKGKEEVGLITLEAKNAGGDVLIIIKDDGRGLDKKKILEKARENGLISRPENDLTDREIFSLIFIPGFSTNDKVSEFSGRGVGMDVVSKNIGKISGSVNVDSIPDEGTCVTIKIPLTLAILIGMTIRVGKSYFMLPIVNIKESFKIKENNVIHDPEGNEMILIRGECYPVLRLHELYKIETKTVNVSDGIIVMVENEGKSLCIFADELIGEQQVVVKALPNYIRNFKKTNGVEGCTLLGDGSISLILGVSELINC